MRCSIQRDVAGLSSLSMHTGLSWLSVCMAFALIGLLAVPRAYALQPPVGAIGVVLTLENSPLPHTGAAGTFTLTRTVLPGGLTIQYTIDRPPPLGDEFFERTASPGTTVAQFNVTAAFVGDHGLLFKVLDRNGTNVRNTVVFLDLSLPNPIEVDLYTHDDAPGVSPNPQFFLNGEGSCLFTPLFVALSANPDTFELTVFRTDTGATLCHMDDQDRQSTSALTAEIIDVIPPRDVSTSVQIRHVVGVVDVATPQVCPLPVADLAVAPQPLAFGRIPNDQFLDRPVTFSNPGQEQVQVTALGATAHFAPVAFAVLTLAPGQFDTRMIRFTPGGTNGPFDENMPITRIPAVGAAVVNCTGSGTTPPPNLVAAPQPLAFGTIVNNQTRLADVTFSNPGQGAVQVTALGSSAHFAPVGFTGFTLQGGQFATRTIRFNPVGAVGTFNENLAITRIPAVGAAVVNCTGTSTLPVVTIQPLTCCVDESATGGVNAFRVTRTGAVIANLTVRVLPGGTATASAVVGVPSAGADYLRLPFTVTIPVPFDHVDIRVVPINDTTDEPGQVVSVLIQTGAGYTPGFPGIAAVTIVDNDPPPVLSIVGRAVPEGGANHNAVVADVTLSARSELPVSVSWNTFTGLIVDQLFPQVHVIVSTATPGPTCSPIAGTDFVTSSGTLNWVAGTTSLVRTITIPICGNLLPEVNDTFFIGLSSPMNATIGGALPPGQTVCSILNDDLVTGSFEMTPTDATVAAQERLTYDLTWTVPGPLNWHDLQTIQFRISDEEDTALLVRWDEATNTFSVFHEALGHFSHDFEPGSHHILQTPLARLHLRHTTVVGSGPTGTTVTLNMMVSFKHQAVGRTFLVEVAASNDQGQDDDFTQAGTVTVTPIHGGDSDDEDEGDDDGG